MINKFNFKHIIWDWNGTLFDDAWLCVEITNGLLKKYGLPTMSTDHYQEIFDFPVKEYYKRIGFDFSIESYENLANEFIEQYENRRLECKLQRDAKKMLSFLHNEGLSQSILSAYRQTSLKDIIRFFSLDSYFVKINGLDNHYAKSKIEIGKKHVASLDFPDEAIALIGDTIHDYTVAQTIGVNCILIPSGHQSKKRLESTSSILLESLADIEHLTTKSTC